MKSDLQTLLTCLQSQGAVLVRVQATRGSVPREVGAWMAVLASGAPTLLGTIGGGRLERDAMEHAQAIQAGRAQTGAVRYTLGPALGQCCGGEVTLQFECVSALDAPALAQRLAEPQAPLALFGAGHVGRALVPVLWPLPFHITWIDSRDEVFPAEWATQVCCEYSDPVQRAVSHLAPQTRVLVMSFSHAEDLEIIAACLLRQREAADLPYVGLIGSHSKWARFQARLRERGFSDSELAHVTCPIGIPGVADKRPEVIAVAVAAQLLQVTDMPAVAAP